MQTERKSGRVTENVELKTAELERINCIGGQKSDLFQHSPSGQLLMADWWRKHTLAISALTAAAVGLSVAYFHRSNSESAPESANNIQHTASAAEPAAEPAAESVTNDSLDTAAVVQGAASEEGTSIHPGTLQQFQIKRLLRDIIRALDHPDVTAALAELATNTEAGTQLPPKRVMSLVDGVQAAVLCKHGFERSSRAVIAFGRAIGPHRGDSEVQQLLMVLRGLMVPTRAQALAKAARQSERDRLGIVLHDMEDNGSMCWCVAESAVSWEPALVAVNRTEIKSVEGASLLLGVLSQSECVQMIQVAEAMGFAADEGLTTGEGVRRNQSTQWWAGCDVAGKLFSRMRPHLPANVDGCRICGLNMRFCVYKYSPHLHECLPHYDDGWEGSGVAWQKDCIAHFDSNLAPGVEAQSAELCEWAENVGEKEDLRTWVSRMTVLLYLNSVDFQDGGTTDFWDIDKSFEPDASRSYEENIREAAMLKHQQQPKAGCAVCFFHGTHQLNALYSDELVLGEEPKYVLRTDVMYLA